MSKIVWRDRMGIGIREIDDDHRTLIDAINRLDDLASAEIPDRSKLAACLLQIIRDTRNHLEREERLMTRIHLPNIAAHLENHSAFIDTILTQAQTFVDEPNAETARSVHAILSDWLTRHVVGVKRAITPHLKARLPVNTVQWTP